jgi:alginate O-acetyltransferase complex protein AlgJ
MHAASVASKIRQFKNIWLSGVFVTLILLPTADSLFHLDHAPPPNEKRLPAEFPDFAGVGGSRQFVSGLEAYFNDHFGFRKRLIRTNNHWKRQLFRDAPANDVLMGRDGWLFFLGNKTLDHAIGAALFSQDDLEAWRLLLEKRRDWLASRGVEYLFVVPPDKHSVYPEYLPEWLVRNLKPGKLDQFMDYMKAHSNVEVLDLRKCLIESKPLGVNYLKTDTHWNSLGAFIGYQELITALRRQMPDLKPLPMDAFQRVTTAGEAGDLGILLGDTYIKEPQNVVFTPLPPLQPLEVVIDPARLPGTSRPRAEPRVTLSTCLRGKAILFRDSFARGWVEFLGYHFKEVIYISQYHWDSAFIEREKPDVVIDEILQRLLNVEDPRELMLKDNLK